jgi:WD40 repeat protein
MTIMQSQTSLHQPYPGLRPYLQAESDLFFGRAEQVNRMLSRLEDNRFLAVVGSSGSGKSSLVRAGLLPALLQGYLLDTGTDWKFIVMKPGDDPFYNLAKESVLKTTDHPDGRSPADIAYTQAMLSRPNGFLDVVEENHLEEGTSLLLLVDQFEEIFRFRTRSADTPLSQGERPIYEERNEAKAFVNLLLDTVTVASSTKRPIYVVITMRSDFIGGCEVFPNLPQAVSDSQFLVPRMTREQMQEAIEKPLLLFDCQAEPAMVNQILNDAESVPDQLPLMQHALMRTWFKAKERWGEKSTDRKLTLMDYEKTGRIFNALSDHLDEAWKTLTDPEKRLTQILFLSLCERNNEGQLVRRPVKLREVAEVAQVSSIEIPEVVKKFQKDERNFIVASPAGSLSNESLLDISHEALLRQWEKLRSWLEKELDSADGYKRLADDAARWKAGKADLLGGLDLEQAEEWRKNLHNPTPAWAKRYDAELAQKGVSRFDEALDFLKKSKQRKLEEEEKREKERKNKKEAEERELLRAKNAQIFATAGCVFFALLSYILGWSLVSGTQAQVRFLKRTAEGYSRKSPANSLAYALASLELQEKLLPPLRDTDSQLSIADTLTKALISNKVTQEIMSEQGQVWSLIQLKNGNLISGGGNGTLRRWDSKGKPMGETINTGHSQVLSLLELNNGDLISGGSDGTLQLWHYNKLENDYTAKLGPVLGKRRRQPIYTGQRGIVSLVQLDSGEVISGGADGTIQRWESNGMRKGRPIRTGQKTVWSLVKMANGTFFTGGGNGMYGSLQRWRNDMNDVGPPIATGQDLRSLIRMENGELISGGIFGAIRRWKDNGTPLGRPVNTDQSTVRAMVELKSKNGELLTAGTDGTIQRWNSDLTPKGNPIDTRQGVALSLLALSSGEFYSGGSDGTIRRWKLSEIKVPNAFIIKPNQLEVSSLLRLRNGELITGGNDGTIRRWDKDGQPIGGAIPTGQTQVKSMIELENGELITGGSDGTIRRWSRNIKQIGDVTKICDKPVCTPVVGMVEFKNRQLVVGGSDGTLQLWNSDLTPLGDPIKTNLVQLYSMIKHKNDQFSVGGLLKNGHGQVIRLTSDGKKKNELDKNQGLKAHLKAPVYSLLELRDGDLITGGGDGRINRWRDGRFQEEIWSNLNEVWSLVETKNGDLILGGGQGMISSWRNGKPLGESIETELAGPVKSMVLLDGGELIASGLKAIRGWPTEETVVRMACEAMEKYLLFYSDKVDKQARVMAKNYCKNRGHITSSSSQYSSSNRDSFSP